MIGNDDDSSTDEDPNPYSAEEDLFAMNGEAGGLPRAAVGQIAQADDPNGFAMRRAAGGDGETAEGHVHFQEFARLSIGNKWYQISDDKPWRIVVRYVKEGEFMQLVDDDVEFLWNNDGW